MRLRELILLMVAFLSVALSATALSDAGSDAKSVSSSDTPLFDYRYTQVAEDLGLLKDGASESKLDYKSIETASLTPIDESKKSACKLTIKQADIDTMDVCQWDTEQTYFDSCGNTCSDSCGGCGQTLGYTCMDTCEDTCGGGCGQTLGYTCLTTCEDTCEDTCGGTCLLSCQTCVLSCGVDTCGNTCSNTCGGTCGITCSNTCGGTCGITCSNTCGGTCGNTCSNTCGSTCGITCRNTCFGTCSNTCANTCARTCGNTCYNTCLATCQMTCAQTCLRTCSPTCSATCLATCGVKCAVPVAAVQQGPDAIPLAKYTATAPSAAEQNAQVSYDPAIQPPALVYYLGTYVPWIVFQQNFQGKEIYAWIETDGGWDVLAKAPRGTWVRELIFVPSNGNMIENKIGPDGIGRSANFNPVVAGYKYIWLYAENPGAYISSFENGGLRSNNVTLIASL